MGSQSKAFTRILALGGYRVLSMEIEGDAPDARMVLFIESTGKRAECSGCARRTSRIRDVKPRAWDDLPWAAHPVTLRAPLRRVDCGRCGIRTERVPFADPTARITRRLRQRIGLDCQSMPTSHAAVKHHVSWSKGAPSGEVVPRGVGRQTSETTPASSRRGRDPAWQKGLQYWTVLSDLVHGEVIGLAKDRTEDALKGAHRDEARLATARGGRGRLHRHAQSRI